VAQIRKQQLGVELSLGDGGDLQSRNDPTSALRHIVLNDYQAIIAFIVSEMNSAGTNQVKDVLTRVAECVYEHASHVRDSG